MLVDRDRRPVERDGRRVPLQGAIYQTVYAPFFPAQLASFLFALSFVLFWLAILWALHRKGIFLKV